MKTSTKIAVIIAVFLLAAGAGLFCLGYFGMGGDLLALDTEAVREVTYSPEGSFRQVSCTGGEGDLRILPAEDGKLKIVCLERERQPYRAEIRDGVLYIRQEERKLRSWQLFHLKETRITLYLPEGQYERLETDLDTGDLTLEPGVSFLAADLRTHTGDVTLRRQALDTLKLEGTTGDVRLENCTLGSLELKTDTGEQYLDSVTAGEVTMKLTTGRTEIHALACASLEITASTGKVRLEDVRTEGELRIRTDTGDVTLRDCDAAFAEIRTDTGDVRGNFLSQMQYVVKTDTGRVKVPDSREGGECRVTTDTGDVDLTRSGEA